VKLKEYRYSGKERDDSTGLYYYGARYYAPWLGRWISADPAGTVDGLNLYEFVGGNPITGIDIGGMSKRTPQNAIEERSTISIKPKRIYWRRAAIR
jgi:RHS repeat-associated protein